MFGAPNVVRGGSHTGWTDATDMVRRGWCAILASDYYYPAPLLAAFRLAELGAAPLAAAWRLIVAGPGARRSALRIAARSRPASAPTCAGRCSSGPYPAVVATIAGGRLVHLTDAARLKL